MHMLLPDGKFAIGVDRQLQEFQEQEQQQSSRVVVWADPLRPNHPQRVRMNRLFRLFLYANVPITFFIEVTATVIPPTHPTRNSRTLPVTHLSPPLQLQLNSLADRYPQRKHHFFLCSFLNAASAQWRGLPHLFLHLPRRLPHPHHSARSRHQVPGASGRASQQRHVHQLCLHSRTRNGLYPAIYIESPEHRQLRSPLSPQVCLNLCLLQSTLQASATRPSASARLTPQQLLSVLLDCVFLELLRRVRLLSVGRWFSASR
jgi:hypothetical protein